MSRRYVIREGVLHATVGGEEVLLDPDVGTYHLINPTGRRLLERMGEGATLDEAIETVALEWQRDPGEVRAHVEPFIAAMIERQLVVASPGE